jgi:hypothetical protein
MRLSLPSIKSDDQGVMEVAHLTLPCFFVRIRTHKVSFSEMFDKVVRQLPMTP